jgi:hypothetical protein
MLHRETSWPAGDMWKQATRASLDAARDVLSNGCRTKRGAGALASARAGKSCGREGSGGHRRSQRRRAEARRPSDERGAALLIVLLAAALIGGFAAALVVTSTTEALISGAHRTDQEVFYATDAMLEASIHDLARIVDWRLVLAPEPGNVTAAFSDGNARPLAPDGRVLSLVTLSAGRQTASDALYGPAVFGADAPSWRLFAHAALGAILPPGTRTAPVYVLVWVADDGADGDGDPSRDTNGRLLIYAEGFGVGGARRPLEAAIVRAGAGVVRLATWKDAR